LCLSLFQQGGLLPTSTAHHQRLKRFRVWLPPLALPSNTCNCIDTPRQAYVASAVHPLASQETNFQLSG